MRKASRSSAGVSGFEVKRPSTEAKRLGTLTASTTTGGGGGAAGQEIAAASTKVTRSRCCFAQTTQISSERRGFGGPS